MEAAQAPEVELAVLGCLYLDSTQAFPIFKEKGRKEYFFSPPNQTAFKALAEFFETNGMINPAGFIQFVTERKILDAIGGGTFISNLSQWADPVACLDYDLEVLREKYVERSLLRIALVQQTELAEGTSHSEIIARREKEFADLRIEASNSKNGALSVRRLSGFLGMTFDETDNYFGDRVIAAGQPCTLLGPGEIGKSRFALQLAICMILGRDFLGMPTHGPNKTWLLIQSENSCRRLYDDLRKMINGLEITQNEEDAIEQHLLIHTLENDYDSFLCLQDDEIYAKVHQLIQKTQPSIVSWDPLNSFTDEDLNADIDMRSICVKISRLTKYGDTSRVALPIHHALTGKAGASKAVGWEKSSYGRNSKVLHSWTRAQINLAPRDPDDPTRLIMSCGKNNNGKAFPEIGILFNEEDRLYLIDPDFDPQSFREEVGIVSKRTFHPRILKDMRWPADVLDKKQLVKVIMDETGCGRARAYELIEQALKSRFIKFNRITSLFTKG